VHPQTKSWLRLCHSTADESPAFGFTVHTALIWIPIKMMEKNNRNQSVSPCNLRTDKDNERHRSSCYQLRTDAVDVGALKTRSHRKLLMLLLITLVVLWDSPFFDELDLESWTMWISAKPCSTRPKFSISCHRQSP